MISIGAGTLADIFEPAERGTKVCPYTAIGTSGPF